MQKKQLYLGLGVGIVILAAIISVFFVLKHKNAQAPQEAVEIKKKITKPVNIMPVEERPYMQIIPLSDGHNLEIHVLAVKKAANQIDYELEYQAGSLLQGAFGLIELDTVPANTKILLGSCSAGGACTYHTQVQGGTLVGNFSGENEYSLKQEWRYIDNKTNESEFSSKDAKFQISSKDLSKQRYIIIYNSPGYPDGLKGPVVSSPYSLTVSGTLKGSADLTIRAQEEGDLVIMGYDGTSWHEFKTTVDGKEATATVDLMDLYVVVTK